MAAHHNVNPQQLRMFMPVHEVIDTVHKGDYGDYSGKTPREQWEGDLNDEDYPQGLSLRAVKLGEHFGNDPVGRNIRASHDEFNEKRIRRGEADPITIALVPKNYRITAEGYRPESEEPELVDGHHRLAYHEKMKRSEIPVTWEGF
jgi:hypothetical protein